MLRGGNAMVPLRRVGSLLVDLGIVAAGAALGLALPLLSGARGWGVLAWMILLGPAFGAVAVVALVVLAVRWRGTPGQRVLGLRVMGDAGPPSGRRMLARMGLLVVLPSLVILGAWASGELARRHVESWGAHHPDWQRRLDEAYARRESIHDRLLASEDTEDRAAAWRAESAASDAIPAILGERDRSWPGTLDEHAEGCIAGAFLLWLLGNGALLFTRRGPVHDRICRLLVERT
jgi:hypothetical protein